MAWPAGEVDADDLQSGLKALFTELWAGDVPGMTSEEAASRVSSAVSQSVRTVSQPSHSSGHKAVDSASLCLTLVGKIVTPSKRLPQDVRVFYEDVTNRLFGAAGLMSELVLLLTCQERLLSHLTAKCVSAFVVRDLCTHGDVNSVWAATCAETFQKSAPGCTLDTCLWSLTEVIKGLLRGECANKRDVLTKLLAGFEASLSSLYSNLLTEAASQQTQAAKNDLNISVATFMDLLEALAAARLRFGLFSSVQRLMFLHASALLRLMDSALGYFVKKRVLLLLKRSVVRKPGEDWALGEGQPAPHGDAFLTGDMLAMAEAVLQEVAAGWLRRLYVKPQPCVFGGNREVSPDGEGKDAVMLRATSLLTVKSLQILHCATEGADHGANVRQYLLELLAFLQERVAQFRGETHSCSWILQVFGEQDDDMMESAKALIALYSHQRRLTSSAPEACSWGCDPHCHFILLLQSLSFDHTVLLDFLISAETCFLEYFVLYLKLLRDHWQDFRDSCRRIEDSGRTSGRVANIEGIQPTSEASLEGPLGTSHLPQSETPHPTTRSLPRLVDYGSSEESEEDGGSVSCLQTKRNAGEPAADTSSRKVVVSAERERMDSTVSLSDKVLVCLTDLRTVITRLHTRGLFPYNPSSLIKLLTAVEAKAQSSLIPQ